MTFKDFIDLRKAVLATFTVCSFSFDKELWHTQWRIQLGFGKFMGSQKKYPIFFYFFLFFYFLKKQGRYHKDLWWLYEKQLTKNNHTAYIKSNLFRSSRQRSLDLESHHFIEQLSVTASMWFMLYRHVGQTRRNSCYIGSQPPPLNFIHPFFVKPSLSWNVSNPPHKFCNPPPVKHFL